MKHAELAGRQQVTSKDKMGILKISKDILKRVRTSSV